MAMSIQTMSIQTATDEIRGDFKLGSCSRIVPAARERMQRATNGRTRTERRSVEARRWIEVERMKWTEKVQERDVKEREVKEREQAQTDNAEAITCGSDR